MSNQPRRGMRPLPTYGDLMSLEQFVKWCKFGWIIDDDGHGYYATESEMTELPAIPSRIAAGKIIPDNKYPYVIWFNK